MSGSANITSIAVLREFRLALGKYRAEAAAALIEAESELSRTLVWLKHDRLPYWTHELRRRQELLTRAKSEMYRSVVASDTDGRAGVDQKKTLERAKRMLAEAEAKMQSVRRWLRILDHEAVLYHGEVQGLSGFLDTDLSQAEARLERMSANLEEYARLRAPGGDPAGAASEDEAGGSTNSPAATQDATAGGEGTTA
ncbi:MAG: hypothetical protein AB7G11_16380 [Phycisphaerales bacterium]